ncbi:unnamed protein product [Linum trigynum]|uniref:BHLH domain-containing protein n=1 Tax=Linum trigynum TaxID=586398 RepID=A0AAV2EW95_9ROSI
MAKPLTTERQRSQQVNDKFDTLRNLIPNPTKDRQSFSGGSLGDAIGYIKELLIKHSGGTEVAGGEEEVQQMEDQEAQDGSRGREGELVGGDESFVRLMNRTNPTMGRH